MDQKRPLTFSLFSLKLLSGLIGGATGTLALFVVFFALKQILPEGEEVTSLSVFVIILMTFIGTLVANTTVGVMVTFLDNEKYSRRKTIITHIFMFNFILFFLTIPLYLLGVGMEITNGIAAVHFLLSAFISALIMEILAGGEYSLLGIYSSAFGIFISIGIALALMATNVSAIAIMFAAMPGVWLILQLIGGIGELVYDNFTKLYGIDALNIQTDLGGDTEVDEGEGEEEDEEDEEDDEDEDESLTGE